MTMAELKVLPQFINRFNADLMSISAQKYQDMSKMLIHMKLDSFYS